MEQVIHLITYAFLHKEIAELESKQNVHSVLYIVGLVVKCLKIRVKQESCIGAKAKVYS